MDWGAIGQAIGGLAALLGAVAATWAVIEARRLRFEQTRPEVIVYLEQNDEVREFLQITVHNIGQAPAYSVSLIPIGDNHDSPLTDMRNTALAEEGVSLMPPHGKLSFELGMYHVVDEEPRRFKLRYFATKDLNPKHEVNESVSLRVTEFRGRIMLSNEPRRAMKALRVAMEKLASGRVQVTVKSKD